jgi:hypothetical protein
VGTASVLTVNALEVPQKFPNVQDLKFAQYHQKLRGNIGWRILDVMDNNNI